MSNFTYHEKCEYSLSQQYETIRKELPDFIRSFLRQLSGRPQTLRDRAFDYLSFLQYLQASNPLFKGIETADFSLDNFSEIVSDDIQQYIQSLAENFANHSINRKISSLKILFRYLYLRGDIPDNPLEGITRMEARPQESSALEAEDISRLLDCILSGRFPNATERQKRFLIKTRDRDAAIFMLILNTGIHAEECIGLDVSDVDLQKHCIQVRNKYGVQKISINSLTVSTLQSYINGTRKTFSDGKASALFLSSRSPKRLSQDALYNLIHKYGEYTGISVDLTPYRMRKAYGTLLYEETGDLQGVQERLRYARIETASRNCVRKEAEMDLGDINLY